MSCREERIQNEFFTTRAGKGNDGDESVGNLMTAGVNSYQNEARVVSDSCSQTTLTAIMK